MMEFPLQHRLDNALEQMASFFHRQNRTGGWTMEQCRWFRGFFSPRQLFLP
jgi:hypothetical protein